MSETELFGIYKNGNVEFYGSTRNSFRGGMHVWQKLNEKYELHDSLFEFKNTWGNFNKGFYEPFEDIVFGSTFDYVIVMKEDFPLLIASFKDYFERYPDSSFSEQAEIIKAMEKDDNIIGVAWCQTSIVDGLWDVEEEDDIIPYNIFKGTRHWNLFKKISKSEE